MASCVSLGLLFLGKMAESTSKPRGREYFQFPQPASIFQKSALRVRATSLRNRAGSHSHSTARTVS